MADNALVWSSIPERWNWIYEKPANKGTMITNAQGLANDAITAILKTSIVALNESPTNMIAVERTSSKSRTSRLMSRPDGFSSKKVVRVRLNARTIWR